MNAEETEEEKVGAGFNRYMVECEYSCLQCVSMVYQVLIDTWWNVNLIM